MKEIQIQTNGRTDGKEIKKTTYSLLLFNPGSIILDGTARTVKYEFELIIHLLFT